MIHKRLLALRDRVSQRAPDFTIQTGRGTTYLSRWWVIPRNKFFNIYLHHFTDSDDDRALHDHPYLFNMSILLDGEYMEFVPDGMIRRYKRDWALRWGKSIHRVELYQFLFSKPQPCWTLFITGPVVRDWGFYCPSGWRHWKLFTSSKDGSSVAGGTSHIGRGCD